MPKFQYVAYTKDGKVEKGVIEAQNQDTIAKILSSKELIPVSIELAKERTLSFSFGKKVKEKELSLVLRQVGFLIQVGISVPQAFEMAAKQIDNKYFQETLLEVAKDVSEGLTVGQAMQKKKKYFSTASYKSSNNRRRNRTAR